jgi:DNA-directed RNA polymerase subunit M/transcription elongation factor TFIIS
MINCPKCNSLFDPNGKWGLKKFCSRSCANSRNFSEEAINKKSESAKANIKSGRATLPDNKGRQLVERIEWQCAGCNKKRLVVPSYDVKYCSKACGIKHGGLGGIREGSGRAKTGYYNGIYCGSTYELCWVIYNLDHNISFTRFPGYLEKDGLKYYPDFLLDDGKTIVEIKGFEDEKVALKTALAEEKGFIVLLLKREDLRDIFDYVTKVYGTKQYHKLYQSFMSR